MNELLSHLRASGGSLVPDTLMEPRDMALLKKCLNDGGTSLPFLHESGGGGGGNNDASEIQHATNFSSSILYSKPQ